MSIVEVVKKAKADGIAKSHRKNAGKPELWHRVEALEDMLLALAAAMDSASKPVGGQLKPHVGQAELHDDPHDYVGEP